MLDIRTWNWEEIDRHGSSLPDIEFTTMNPRVTVHFLLLRGRQLQSSIERRKTNIREFTYQFVALLQVFHEHGHHHVNQHKLGHEHEHHEEDGRHKGVEAAVLDAVRVGVALVPQGVLKRNKAILVIFWAERFIKKMNSASHLEWMLALGISQAGTFTSL